MGKALVIYGADFSKYNVGNVSVNENVNNNTGGGGAAADPTKWIFNLTDDDIKLTDYSGGHIQYTGSGSVYLYNSYTICEQFGGTKISKIKFMGGKNEGQIIIKHGPTYRDASTVLATIDVTVSDLNRLRTKKLDESFTIPTSGDIVIYFSGAVAKYYHGAQTASLMLEEREDKDKIGSGSTGAGLYSYIGIDFGYLEEEKEE